jgi:ethanolamine utilization protein EutA (predicted chaperonin)
VKCGETFTKEKELKKHDKDCEMTLVKRLDDITKTMALLVANHADMSKKITELSGADVEDGVLDTLPADDTAEQVRYAVRDGKLYKYSKTAKTFGLADIGSMINALVKNQYDKLL